MFSTLGNGDLSSQPKVKMTTKTSKLKIGLVVIKGEMLKTQWLLQKYIWCFDFSLKELCQLKGQEVHIILEDDNSIFKWPYKLNEVEKAFAQAKTINFLYVGLVELFWGEYVSTTMMSTKKYLWQLNWMSHVWGLPSNESINMFGQIWHECQCWKRFLMPLGMPRCSTLWICTLATITCYWKKVTRSRLLYGDWSQWERLFVPMVVLIVWFE